ncbi:GNAT family N-acetyltransferase [Streptomyces sp. cmx-18-6]|uniref:GNAT family N-acetyltransferase n=1 Tax=Streptomyces sp. cmx-18-6 TaxID=2790930 RepID=UPI00397FD96E
MDDDLTTPRLTLHRLSPEEARELIECGPQPGEPDQPGKPDQPGGPDQSGGGLNAARWAPDYPDGGDVSAARRYLDSLARAGERPHPGVYEIRTREDGRAVGGVGFHGPADDTGSVTIGYGLVPSARGRGYASEALRAVLESARRSGIARVKGDADHDNTASHHVMTAAGMRRVGEDERVGYYESTWTPEPAPPGPEDRA